MNSTSTGMPSEARRRLQNLAALWNPRMQATKTDAEMAKVCFDRAKAAAVQAKRSVNPQAMHELAELLATWAAQQEEAEARRRVRHAS